MTFRTWHSAVALAGLLAGAWSGAASAASVTIIDLTDGNPTVSASPDIVNFGFRASPDAATVLGTVPNFPAGQPVPTLSFGLSEPNGDFNPPNSDAVTIAPFDGPPGSFILTFESDTFGSVGGPNLRTIPEDGTLQVLPFGIPNLTINVQSDLGTPEPVPEPASLAVLLGGLGLLGMARRLSK